MVDKKPKPKKLSKEHREKIRDAQKGKNKNLAIKLNPVTNEIDESKILNDMIGIEDLKIIKRALFPPPPKKGRKPPLSFNDREIRLIVSLASAGVTEAVIAECLCLNGSKMHTIKKNNKMLKAIIDVGKANRLQKISNVVYTKAIEGNLTACFFILKCQFNWNDHPEVDNSSTKDLIGLIRDLSGKKK